MRFQKKWILLFLFFKYCRVSPLFYKKTYKVAKLNLYTIQKLNLSTSIFLTQFLQCLSVLTVLVTYLYCAVQFYLTVQDGISMYWR